MEENKRKNKIVLRPEKMALTQMVAKLCQDAGYDGAEPITLEVLTNVSELFLDYLASAMKRYSEYANRTHPSLVDLELVLLKVKMPWQQLELSATKQMHIEKIKMSQASSVLSPSIPFFRSVNPLSLGTDKLPQAPEHLPALPSSHTFKYTPVKTERQDDPQTIREKSAHYTRIGVDNLKRLLFLQHEVKKPKTTHQHTDTIDLFEEVPNTSSEQIDTIPNPTTEAEKSTDYIEADVDTEDMPFVNYEMSKFVHIQKGSTIKSLGKFSG